ncbi:MAG: dihydroorotase [Clostridia bacterium]|nr:dihydroorotase [Clostridia bacterium]
MKTLFRNGTVYCAEGGFRRADILSQDGVVVQVSQGISTDADRIFDLRGLHIFPGFADAHVHLREPGFSYKETIASGSLACAHGGYTTVCAMPNLDPPIDCDEHLRIEEEIIRRDAVIRVLPYASITMGRRGQGELVDMAALRGRVCGFSDDGTGVSDESVMRAAMTRCKDADSIIAAHCEDLSLIPKGTAIHDGAYARAHGMNGIPSESEWGPIRRDIELCRETGCRYHVCHISTRESLDLIKKAKAEGVNITCETAPHYLLLSEDDLQDEGRFKMNPPLRAKEDLQALRRGFIDGDIDMLSTDHAPHSAEEKSRGLAGSAMGIVGIETAFPLIYTHFVKTGLMPLEALVDRISLAARRRFRLGGGIREGERLELCAFDLSAKQKIDPAAFKSLGKATPFAGWEVYGVCRYAVCEDRVLTF